LDFTITTRGSNLGFTLIVAEIIIYVVTVIAFLHSDVQNRIATPGEAACASTCIALHEVAIIAGLFVSPDDAIPAAGSSTGIEASIFVDGVAIITELGVLDDPIATCAGLADGTSIRGILVAIIAAFTGSEDAVSTAVHLAITETVILILFVAVVAGLKARVFGLEVVTDHTIATPGQLAVAPTGISICLITIITGFKAQGTFG